jgi:hypothetical protein
MDRRCPQAHLDFFNSGQSFREQALVKPRLLWPGMR